MWGQNLCCGPCLLSQSEGIQFCDSPLLLLSLPFCTSPCCSLAHLSTTDEPRPGPGSVWSKSHPLSSAKCRAQEERKRKHKAPGGVLLSFSLCKGLAALCLLNAGPLT